MANDNNNAFDLGKIFTLPEMDFTVGVDTGSLVRIGAGLVILTVVIFVLIKVLKKA